LTVTIFHPLLIEAVRDARPLDDNELKRFAEAIRAEIRAADAPADPPLFKWARRAIEGSRIS
jgi:hypothetical protein